MSGSIAGTPAPEKKPVKKRKSWGQQLPEPKTNLPPRKRAKTEDEKEQRRVERVLRNRRAAQSSRERKRQEVEALEAQKQAVERQNQDLQMRLADSEAKIAALQAELERIGGSSMTVFRGSSAPASPEHNEQFRQAPTPITFSQELFGSSKEADNCPIPSLALVEPGPKTVNPASLSPEIRAVAESTNASSPDMTQQPAALLCDLQCQSEDQRPWTDSIIISQILAMTFFINMTSGVISNILSPLSQIISSLRTGSPLSSTNSILTLVIWLATTTATLTTSSPSMTSSTKTTYPRMKFSLRISLLRRLLACSPNLARPLMDATMVAMRSASEQQLPDCLSSVDASQGSSKSPSVEALMTLLWTIHVIEKERIQRLETPELDAATEVRQACMELDELYRRREANGEGVWSYVSQSASPGGIAGWAPGSQKSLDGWRMAFNKHG